MGSLLAQENEDKVETAVYYLSKRMTGYELNYSTPEKVCWALAWVTKRLRHYMQAHPIKLVSRLDPIHYLFQRTLLSPRFAKWMMMISEYDITYMAQKYVKGSVIADFLADQPIIVEPSFELDFPDDSIMSITSDTWKLMFDGASSKHGYRIGILLIDPQGTYNPISIKLEYSVTNNEAEYEACLSGLKIAYERGATKLDVIGDSNLVISQVNGTWQVRGKNLKPYHTCLLRFIDKFDHVSFIHTPRSQNRFADALVTLAAMTQIPVGIKVKPLKIRQKRKSDFEVGVEASVQVPTKLWFDILQNYIVYGEYPSHFRAKE
ncbi:uncharacterized protein LOC124943560 [Impatiens glandulifera]|uniref:uncharacterized protein LOC124943560 n=1 Tax=Impatiens glandulifera TaxID=253017 RepID=UPI001FB07E2A|nr:uncharacterized protein LOC124943560 [Impatiens glandulifera]